MHWRGRHDDRFRRMRVTKNRSKAECLGNMPATFRERARSQLPQSARKNHAVVQSAISFLRSVATAIAAIAMTPAMLAERFVCPRDATRLL